MGIKDVAVRLAGGLIANGFRVPKVSPLTRYQELSDLKDLLDRLGINVVLDVGANRGFYAQNLRRIGYSGHIFCFEPILFDCREIWKKSQFDESWRALNVALGSANSVMEFNTITTGGQTVFSSFLPPKTKFANTEVAMVRVQRLDQLAEELLSQVEDPRIFLKTDTQGFDLEVWKGAEGIHDRIFGLQSELSVIPIYENTPHYTEMLEYLEKLGFCLMRLSVVNYNSQGGILEYDCVMAKLDKIAKRDS